MRRRWGVIALVLIVPAATRLPAQALTVSRTGEMLHVRAPSLTFIKGAALDRLRAGGSVHFDVDLVVLSKPDGPVVIQTRQSFNVSYDLWEERFAVVRIGPPSSSISHLTARDAEQWCLAQLAVPAAPVERLGRAADFWITLAFHMRNGARAANTQANDRFTLRGLIDALSRRPQDDVTGSQELVQAGPFRLMD